MHSSGLKTLYKAGYIKSADFETLKDLAVGENYQCPLSRNGQVRSAVCGLFGIEIHIQHYDDTHFHQMMIHALEFNLNYTGYGAEQSHSCLVINEDAIYISYKKKFICFPEWPDEEDTFPQFRLFYFGRNFEWLTPIFPELDEQVEAIYVEMDIQLEVLGDQVRLIKNKLYYRRNLRDQPTVESNDEAGWYSFPYQIQRLVLETDHWYKYYLINKGVAQFEASAPQALKHGFKEFLHVVAPKKRITRQLLRWEKRLAFELLLYTRNNSSDFKRMYHFMVVRIKSGQGFTDFIHTVYAYFECSFGHPLNEETKRQLAENLLAGYARLATNFKSERALQRYLMNFFMAEREVSRDHFIPDFTIDHRYNVLKSTSGYTFEFIDNSRRLQQESRMMGNCAKNYWKEMLYQKKVFYHIIDNETISMNTIYTLCLNTYSQIQICELESILNGGAPKNLYDEIVRQLADAISLINQ